MHRQSWKRLLVAVSLALLPACGGELPHGTDAPGPLEELGDSGRFLRSVDAIPGQYIVVLKGSQVTGDSVPDVARALADRYGGTVTRTYSHELPGFVVRMREEDARALAALPEVDSVVEDRLGARAQLPGLDDTFVDTGSGAPSTVIDPRNNESLTSCSLFNFPSSRGKIGQKTLCTCPAQPEGNAWGTDIYTDDSNVCVAAQHAGILPAGNGGWIVVTIEPQRSRYTGTIRNNVTTRSYGAWGGSVSVEASSCYNFDFPAYRGSNGLKTVCECPPLPAEMKIWGTDIYTDDSHVCMASAHAGATPSSGGTTVVTNLPGQASYTGSVRWGLPSLSYGAWVGSISFAGAKPRPTGYCQDYDFRSYRGLHGLQIACRCQAGAVGSAWGTDIYTDDSSVCVAAVHSGAISASLGGAVLVTVQPGQASYTGSTSNGITTRSYGSWLGSFYVGRW